MYAQAVRLWLTLVTEAAIPVFVIGLAGWDRGMTIHGAIVVLAGLGFGSAVIRARVLPRWTGIALMAGVVRVAISQSLPEGAQLFAAAIRDLGFAGMGGALLLRGRATMPAVIGVAPARPLQG